MPSRYKAKQREKMAGRFNHFQKKPKVDKTPYTIYNPHTIPVSERKWDQGYYQVVSVDPATKTYTIRVERRYFTGQIIPLHFVKVKLNPDPDATLMCTAYDNLTNLLDSLMPLFEESHMFMVERQPPVNYKTVRISQHTLSYFMIKMKNRPLLPLIIDVDPKLKGKQLGAPKGINEKQLKIWAVEKATELLLKRGDHYSLDIIHKTTKKDDLADTVCQIEAVFGFLRLPLTPEPVPQIRLNITQPVGTVKLNIIPS